MNTGKAVAGDVRKVVVEKLIGAVTEGVIQGSKIASAHLFGLGKGDEAGFSAARAGLDLEEDKRIQEFLVYMGPSDTLMFRLIITTIPDAEDRIKTLKRFAEIGDNAQRKEYFDQIRSKPEHIARICRWIKNRIYENRKRFQETVISLQSDQVHSFLDSLLWTEKIQFTSSVGGILDDQERKDALLGIIGHSQDNAERREFCIGLGYINPWILTDIERFLVEDLGEFSNQITKILKEKNEELRQRRDNPPSFLESFIKFFTPPKRRKK